MPNFNNILCVAGCVSYGAESFGATYNGYALSYDISARLQTVMPVGVISYGPVPVAGPPLSTFQGQMYQPTTDSNTNAGVNNAYSTLPVSSSDIAASSPLGNMGSVNSYLADSGIASAAASAGTLGAVAGSLYPDVASFGSQPIAATGAIGAAAASLYPTAGLSQYDTATPPAWIDIEPTTDISPVPTSLFTPDPVPDVVPPALLPPVAPDPIPAALPEENATASQLPSFGSGGNPLLSSPNEPNPPPTSWIGKVLAWFGDHAADVAGGAPVGPSGKEIIQLYKQGSRIVPAEQRYLDENSKPEYQRFTGPNPFQ